MPTKSAPKMPLALFVERILLIMTLLGLACLSIGFIIFMAGKSFNDLTASQVGAYVLLIGAAFVAMRVFYWILEGIVGRGVDELSKQANII